MIILFCTVAALIALLDFVLLMFTELIHAILGLFPKVQNLRKQRQHTYERRKRK